MTVLEASERRPAADATARGVDVRALVVDLLNEVRGEVKFDAGARALYATDASNYRQLPMGVVVPRDVDDVVATVAIAARHDAPIFSRGGGTALAGQTCNTGVVIDFSRHVNRLLGIDAQARTARVEPGIVLDTLRDAAEQHGLTFGPDPATHNHCTLGGMLGNNSCGVHSVYAGKTVDNTRQLDVLTYDGLRLSVGATGDEELASIIGSGGRRGEIYAALRDIRDTYADEIRARYPNIPRRVSGYNLDQLLPENGFNVARALVGTESTCVTILGATLDLVHSPKSRSLLVLGYPDVFAAADDVPFILESKPLACEGLDRGLVKDMLSKGLHPDDVGMLPDGDGWLLVEFGGDTREESDAAATELRSKLQGRSNAPSTHLYERASEEAKLWEVRESGLGATANITGRSITSPGWEDSAVPPDRFGDYLRDIQLLFDRYDYRVDKYGHFGDGVLHCRIPFDLETAEGVATMRRFVGDASDLVMRYGGSFSGEHGDGQSRGELLPKMFGDRLVQAFSEFKSAWDPRWRMNPGKVVRPNPIVGNLRLGTDYAPATPTTHFQYPGDQFSFANAALRCVGVGKCRREEGGTMCPSYMVTHEEQHSTRGRARLLFEMLNGAELRKDGWRSEPVREALDLCLACKGCKGDCPVDVDMATYKAEFLSHYYSGRLRPAPAYAMGMIYWWAGLASRAPRLVNALTSAPVVSGLGKRLAGLAPQRTIPKFAPATFRQWWRTRSAPARVAPRGRVVLWADTFNNHFHPSVAKAAVTVLEDAGYEVVVPERRLCCGRPLYDWGMLDLAKGLLRQTMRELRSELRAGTPIVGLEPSCISVFRDEARELYPRRPDARRLQSQSYLLTEFLAQEVPDHDFGTLEGSALVHQHCHHKSVLNANPEPELFGKLGLDVDLLSDDGCCGMAGSFGFEADKYDVSVAVGERELLPRVRGADPDTMVVTGGFSCREQIRQLTPREAQHPAEVIAEAIQRRDA